MQSRISTSRELLSAILDGRITHAKRLWVATTNPEWDRRMKGHPVPDWTPVRIKKSFYDSVDFALNLDIFLFTDDDRTAKVTQEADSTYVYESSTFKYLFKEGEDAGAVSAQ